MLPLFRETAGLARYLFCFLWVPHHLIKKEGRIDPRVALERAIGGEVMRRKGGR